MDSETREKFVEFVRDEIFTAESEMADLRQALNDKINEFAKNNNMDPKDIKEAARRAKKYIKGTVSDEVDVLATWVSDSVQSGSSD